MPSSFDCSFLIKWLFCFVFLYYHYISFLYFFVVCFMMFFVFIFNTSLSYTTPHNTGIALHYTDTTPSLPLFSSTSSHLSSLTLPLSHTPLPQTLSRSHTLSPSHLLTLSSLSFHRFSEEIDEVAPGLLDDVHFLAGVARNMDHLTRCGVQAAKCVVAIR